MKLEAANHPFCDQLLRLVHAGLAAVRIDAGEGDQDIGAVLSDRRDLMITMKPETFAKLTAKMTPPPLLMLTGQMRVKGFGAMGTFAKMFPEPKPDQVIEPPGGGLVVG